MSGSIWDLIMASGPVATIVLLILFAFSVVSWAIIGQKLAAFHKAKKASIKFLKAFNHGENGAQLYRLGNSLRVSPLCALFCAVYERSGGKRHKWFAENEDLWQMVDVHISGACEHLERHLVVLATVGSVSPFIGLFGTVWGIMDAFRHIGLQGSANLAVVAPGIAEALIATAAGLAAAIPAVMAYNHFLKQIGSLTRSAEQFAPDLVVWLKAEAKAE